VGTITKGREGQDLAEIGMLSRAGAVGFSDDGAPVPQSGMMLRALNYVKQFDRPLMEHCEDKSLSGSGVMSAGPVALRLGLAGIPHAAEDIAVHRNIALCETAKARLHVMHVATRGSVQLVREAKKRGAQVTTEACPHHFLLTDEACATYDPNFKMSPPLRTRDDVAAILAGLADGTIDCLCSDHAPHSREGKELEFTQAPFGVIGLETLLPLAITHLVKPGRISWLKLAELFSVNPARIFKLKGGSLKVGTDADLTLIDPGITWKIDINQFKSKSRNCPFQGWDVVGRAEIVVVGGCVKLNRREKI